MASITGEMVALVTLASKLLSIVVISVNKCYSELQYFRALKVTTLSGYEYTVSG